MPVYGTLTRLHDTRVPRSRIISPLIHRSARDAVNIRPSLAPRTGGRGSNVPSRGGDSRYTCEARYRLFLRYSNRDSNREIGRVGVFKLKPRGLIPRSAERKLDFSTLPVRGSEKRERKSTRLRSRGARWKDGRGNLTLLYPDIARSIERERSGMKA